TAFAFCEVDAACNQESSKNRVGRHSTAPRLDLTPELSAASRRRRARSARRRARERQGPPERLRMLRNRKHSGKSESAEKTRAECRVSIPDQREQAKACSLFVCLVAL